MITVKENAKLAILINRIQIQHMQRVILKMPDNANNVNLRIAISNKILQKCSGNKNNVKH